MNDLLEALADPQMRHAAFVHAPIVLSFVALALAVALACTRGRNRTLRWVTLVGFALLAVALWVAADSGHDAHREMGNPSIEARRLVDRHEDLAETLWILGVAGLVAVGLTWAPRRPVAIAGLVLALGCGGLTALRIGRVAHMGGVAVYRFGVGTSTASTPAPDAAERAAEDPRAAFFTAEVRPLLERRCMSCHGPQEFAAAGLSLTTMRGILAGGRDGPAVDPGSAEDSLLYRAIDWSHPTLRMPKGGDRLPDEKIAVLKRWIDEGAVWVDSTR